MNDEQVVNVTNRICKEKRVNEGKNTNTDYNKYKNLRHIIYKCSHYFLCSLQFSKFLRRVSCVFGLVRRGSILCSLGHL